MTFHVQTFEQKFISEETSMQDKADSKAVAKRWILTQAVHLEKEFSKSKSFSELMKAKLMLVVW